MFFLVIYTELDTFSLVICSDMEMVFSILRTDIEMVLGKLRPGIEMFVGISPHRRLQFVHFVGSTLCKSPNSKKDLSFSIRTLVLSLLFSRALPFKN